MGDKKYLLIILFLIASTLITAQTTFKRGTLLLVDIRKTELNFADSIWHWEDYRSNDRYIIDECLEIFLKNNILYLLTSRDFNHYYLPSFGSRAYKVINTSSQKEFNVATTGHAVDIIGEPYVNQFGKIVLVNNGFWFLGGALIPSTYFDENDSTYEFFSKSENGIRLTHILGKIGNEYLVAIRREQKSNDYYYYLSNFSSLPSLSIGKNIIFSNSKNSFCLPQKIELLQDSLYVIEYECTLYVDLALLSKDSLKTISENVSVPSNRILKNSELIYTEFNSLDNNYELYKSVFNREKLLFEKKEKLIGGLSSTAVFDTSLVSWIRNDSLFVFDYKSNQYVNKYSLSGLTIKPTIFQAYPYIILDQVLLISDVKNEVELTQNFSLAQNYPNPFNPATTITFTISNIGTRHASTLHHVTLKIYDLLGREVAILVDEYKYPGNYSVQFEADNTLSTGIYFYQLKADSFVSTKKMIFLK